MALLVDLDRVALLVDLDKVALLVDLDKVGLADMEEPPAGYLP